MSTCQLVTLSYLCTLFQRAPEEIRAALRATGSRPFMVINAERSHYSEDVVQKLREHFSEQES